MATSKTQMQMLERKLDKIEIEIMKLKAALLPKEKLSKKEKKELESIKKDMDKGNWVSARELIKQLG
jgi:ATP-dependent protease ClpP protease subunit